MHPSILTFLGDTDWRRQILSRCADRQRAINELVDEMVQQIRSEKCVRLTFVCTHNSRRSQFAQVWAEAAATYFGLNPTRVQCYSGGTETTACNVRTIGSLERSGFVISHESGDALDAASNPKYSVAFSRSDQPVECYSKVYDSDANPQSDFIAVMCCDHAAETCPVVRGANARVMMFYEDPKVSDDSPAESSTYDERSRQIGQDMWMVMGAVAELTRRDG